MLIQLENMDFKNTQFSSPKQNKNSKYQQRTNHVYSQSIKNEGLLKNRVIKNILDEEQVSGNEITAFSVNSGFKTKTLPKRSIFNSRSLNFDNAIRQISKDSATNLKSLALKNIVFNKTHKNSSALPIVYKSSINRDQFNTICDASHPATFIQTSNELNSSKYDQLGSSFDYIKSKRSMEVKKLPMRFNKEFFNLNGSKVNESAISERNMDHKRNIKINNTQYFTCDLNEFKHSLRKESSCYNKSKLELVIKKVNEDAVTNNHFRSRSDFNMYKSIFERPIIFKDNSNREFKLSETEYNQIEKADLLENCEKEENKMLITMKKSWLIRGVIDQLYPQIMALRTSLIRKGLISK